MPAMFSYPHRQKSGQITCYLNRTYHVLTTPSRIPLDNCVTRAQNSRYPIALDFWRDFVERRVLCIRFRAPR